MLGGWPPMTPYSEAAGVKVSAALSDALRRNINYPNERFNVTSRNATREHESVLPLTYSALIPLAHRLIMQ